MGITNLFRRNAVSSPPDSLGALDAPNTARTQRARRAGGQTRAEIRTTRRTRIRDLREKVELANLKRVLAYQRACSKADRSGLARPAYPELLTTETVRAPAHLPATDQDARDGSLMPAVAALLASGVARLVTDAATRASNVSPEHGLSPAGNPGTNAKQ